MSENLAVSDVPRSQSGQSRAARGWEGSVAAGRASDEQANLRVVLNRIMHAAVELVGAEFGALVLVSPHGERSEFMSVGLRDELEADGEFPPTLGLVESILADPHPIRLTAATAQLDSGTLPGDWAVDDLLGVPIIIGDEVLGVIYLGNHVSGQFSDGDERVLLEFAAAAALAVDHGRLAEDARRRRVWAATSAEVASALLSSADGEAMDLFADRLLHLAEADFVGVFQVSQVTGSLVANTVRGVDEDNIEGAVFPMSGSFAMSVLEGKHPVLLDERIDSVLEIVGASAFGPAMAIPLLAPRRAEAVLLVARVQGSGAFSLTDLELTADFAELATIAIELTAPRSTR